MKRLFLSAIQRQGTSYKVDKLNGKPFDFTQLNVARPFEASNEANFKSRGFGFDTESLDLDPMAITQFEGLKLGQEVDLILEPQPNNARRTWVTGRNK
jgi:hypothetical protein